LILGGAVAMLVLTGCGSGEQHRPAAAAPLWDFGHLAGYATEHHVDAIGASWTVPSLREGSRDGGGGDGIGAQRHFGEGPFIQVGTIAQRFGRRDLPDSDVYIAFWSDRAHRFKPVPLFEVTPLTTVTASLKQRRGRWLVSIRDGSRRA